jgi:hypothetical protein
MKNTEATAKQNPANLYIRTTVSISKIVLAGGGGGGGSREVCQKHMIRLRGSLVIRLPIKSSYRPGLST